MRPLKHICISIFGAKQAEPQAASEAAGGPRMPQKPPRPPPPPDPYPKRYTGKTEYGMWETRTGNGYGNGWRMGRPTMASKEILKTTLIYGARISAFSSAPFPFISVSIHGEPRRGFQRVSEGFRGFGGLEAKAISQQTTWL